MLPDVMVASKEDLELAKKGMEEQLSEMRGRAPIQLGATIDPAKYKDRLKTEAVSVPSIAYMTLY